MRNTLLALLALALASVARSQAVDLKTVLGPNRSFHDSEFGVKLTYPAGWEIATGGRWGKNNGENTFRFQPIWPSPAVPSLYYQRFSPDHPRPTDFEAYYRDAAERKAASRVGLKEYRNLPETFSFRPIAGRPGCSYTASYVSGTRKMAEYFVRISGQTVQVMFFTQGPAEDIDTLRAEIDRMAETVQVP